MSKYKLDLDIRIVLAARFFFLHHGCVFFSLVSVGYTISSEHVCVFDLVHAHLRYWLKTADIYIFLCLKCRDLRRVKARFSIEWRYNLFLDRPWIKLYGFVCAYSRLLLTDSVLFNNRRVVFTALNVFKQRFTIATVCVNYRIQKKKKKNKRVDAVVLCARFSIKYIHVLREKRDKKVWNSHLLQNRKSLRCTNLRAFVINNDQFLLRLYFFLFSVLSVLFD